MRNDWCASAALASRQARVQAFIYYSLALRGEVAAQDRLEALRARMSVPDIDAAQKLVAASS